MTDLRTAAQQALDDLKDLHTNHNITYAGTIWRLEAALAQEPHRDLRVALQAPGCERLREWVEIGPVQRAALETFVAALAQEQAEPAQSHRWKGDHNIESPANACMHKSYCMSLKAEPVQQPVAKVELMKTGGNAGLATRIVEIDDHLRERLRPGQLLYAAPPKLVPLTDEEILRVKGQFRGTMNAQFVEFARAIERAHGIGGQDAQV